MYFLIKKKEGNVILDTTIEVPFIIPSFKFYFSGATFCLLEMYMLTVVCYIWLGSMYILTLNT